MKKILIVGTIYFVLLGIFVGCGGKNGALTRSTPAEITPVTELDKAVSKAILDENQYNFLDGEVIADLEYVEDSNAQVDANVVLTKSGKIIEFQTTAEGAPYKQEQLIELFNMAKSAIMQIIELY